MSLEMDFVLQYSAKPQIALKLTHCVMSYGNIL